MAYRQESPDSYPLNRYPPGSVGGPPTRPPPRVHWDVNPTHFGSPPRRLLPGGGGSPPYRYSDDDPVRFAGGNSPQRYIEGPPPGYRDSPPGRFPGRRNPQYLSPEDSPPYRYIEDAPRRGFGDGATSGPFYEDDVPASVGFREEPPRRYGPGYGGYRGEGPHRLVGSESPSPPPGYFPPPPPPPGGAYGEEHPRRFGASVPVQFRQGGSPPQYVDDPPPRYGEEVPRRFYDDSFPEYLDEPPRRFGGASPGQFHDDPPRRFSSTPPRRPDGPPPGYNEGPPRKHGDTPPRRPDESPPQEDDSRNFAGIPAAQLHPATAPVPAAAPLQAAAPFPIVPPGPPAKALHDHPKYPPDVFAPGNLPPHTDPAHPHPRFPPDVFGAAGRPRTPPSGDASPPDELYRYTEGLPGPASSPPDVPLRVRPRSGGSGYEQANLPPDVTPPREPYRLPPPGLGTNAPLLPPGFVTPPRSSAGRREGGSPPQFVGVTAPRRQPDGYIARTPPRDPPRRPPGLGHDAIYTADVVPIELNDELKKLQPHQGNPGSSTGGGWKDLWVAFFFLLHIGCMIALSFIFGLQGLKSTIENYNSDNSFHINDWFPQLAAAAVVGAVFSCIWQTALRLHPVIMIQITVWSGAAMMTLVGIVLLATGYNTGLIGLGFLFVGICQGLYAFIVRERIPFAGEMLKKVIAVCSSYPSTFGISYFFVLVSLLWLAIWIFGLSGSGVRSKHAAIMVAYVVSLLWTMQVIRNIVRVTVAGTVSLVYFQERNMPAMPTYISLFRACTTSLGSICVGSLFVPLIEAPCHVLRRINAQAGPSEFMFSCVVCLLSCFDILIRYFNRMGYIQVAIYGKPFLRASKDTWDMLQAQDVDVLVHDDLTNTVIFIACGVGGSWSALVGGIWTFVAHKSLTIVIALLSFLIGGLISYITMAVVESGVATYYVCFAEDPASLQRYDGPLYEKMWVRQMELLSPGNEAATWS